jgi:histidine ammonia-lyase
VTSAALVAENRALATPCSVDSIPTSAGQEDHVSMATHAARRSYTMALNAAYVVAIELLSAAQGADLRSRGTLVDGTGDVLAAGSRGVYEVVRKIADFLSEDRVLAGEIEQVQDQVLANALRELGGISLSDDGAADAAEDAA